MDIRPVFVISKIVRKIIVKSPSRSHSRNTDAAGPSANSAGPGTNLAPKLVFGRLNVLLCLHLPSPSRPPIKEAAFGRFHKQGGGGRGLPARPRSWNPLSVGVLWLGR